ncbi:MAG: SDR family oxidoreductase [Firmicutes bacterium]|nr:SDR family oxidoreductase [Bacillota bacterium]
MSERKVAVVTGGSRGIGRGIALELASEGYDIAFSYREYEEGARDVRALIEEKGVRCRYYQIAMENLEDVARMVDQAHEDLGRIDVMVCNAAKDRRFSILVATPEDMDFMTSTLYSAQMLSAGAAARHMVKDGIRGSILFITSVHGQMINTSDFAYGGMKAAVERSCKSLALELAPYHIRVNCIAPGAINTRNIDDDTLKYPYRDIVPLGRRGKVEDIAHAAAFLSSDKADYITGEIIRIDGALALPSIPEGWAQAYPLDKAFIQRSYEELQSGEVKSKHV